ncbi:MAG: prepilin-type N-terminal cleavage/methylation domain-containing protein [Nitrospirae bacterium]|uniref:GspH/FimT family pseudopilin n=1 Tax=Candidatus Magnetobacterium casense TaxID=1455061 RepID=UPI00058B4EDA|nr:GspH/FimT family pseudopilin [Candidatus Magnetobacterium casensis]MBF0338030.1 prepilin-type N-terminal cleavage/methylation domain-containing protein [Nitrospirota bacterium]
MRQVLNRRGFTLIEIIVVLLLMMIIMAVVAVGFTHSSPTAKLRAAVRELAATMRYMKNMAQLKGQEQILTVDMDSGLIVYKNRTKTLPKGVSIAINDPNEGELTRGKWTVTFYAEGGSTGGEIKLFNQKHSFLVTIDPVVGSVISK